MTEAEVWSMRLSLSKADFKDFYFWNTSFIDLLGLMYTLEDATERICYELE